jgi:TerC family integral membrane protein
MSLLWTGFVALILCLLALDLGVFHRRVHVVSIREALKWTGVWVTAALLFNALVYVIYQHHWMGMGTHPYQEPTGKDAALKFLTGYIVEESLSLDNVFVIALIFSYFRIPARYQHRVLFWGILGAQIMRGVMIGAGTALIHRFDWVIYVFGAFLIFTAVKLMFTRQETMHPERNWLVRWARKVYPVSTELDDKKFFTRVNGRRAATPLFLVLLLVESSDIMFAVDSIPAIFAITQDPFIVYTSNIFAILGLRSLYFALAGSLDKFRYLRISLVFVLGFVGAKMLLSHHRPIPIGVSLGVIVGILIIGALASVAMDKRDARRGGDTY